MMRKYERPIPIVTKVGRALYKVVTPEWMKVQLVFDVNSLMPYFPDNEDSACNDLARADVNIKLPKR